MNLRIWTAPSASSKNATGTFIARRCLRKRAILAARFSTTRQSYAQGESGPASTGIPSTSSYETILKRLETAETLLSNGPSSSPSRTQFWRTVLSASREKLRAGSSSSPGGAKKARSNVVVYGIEDTSAEDLVTFLLEDPLSSDEKRRDRIRNRWQGASKEPLALSSTQDNTEPTSSRTLQVASPFLQPNRALVEIPWRASPQTHSVTTLFTADVPILVLNPFATPEEVSQLAQSLPPSPRTILIINTSIRPGTQPAAVAESHVRNLLNLDKYHLNPHILFVDVSMALEAIDTLRSDPSSATVVQKYQDLYARSGISALTSRLDEVLQDGNSLEIVNSRAENAGRIVDTAFAVWDNDITESLREVERVRVITHDMRLLVEKTENDFLDGVLHDGTPHSAQPGTHHINKPLPIRDIVSKTRKDVQRAVDRDLSWGRVLGFSWWNSTHFVIENAIHQSSLRELETRLLFHAGRLADLQSSMNQRTKELLWNLPSTFDSALHKNFISQTLSNPQTPITPASLLGSLHSRFSQLRVASQSLDQKADSISSQFWGLFFADTMLYRVYEWIYPILEWDDFYMAIGGVSLIAAGLLRWSVGRWERAKSAWMTDLARVGEGLERDLREDVKLVMEKKAFLVPIKACELLEEAAEAKEKKLLALREQVTTALKST